MRTIVWIYIRLKYFILMNAQWPRRLYHRWLWRIRFKLMTPAQRESETNRLIALGLFMIAQLEMDEKQK